MTYAHEALIIMYVYAPLAAAFSVGALEWIALRDERRWDRRDG